MSLVRNKSVSSASVATLDSKEEAAVTPAMQRTLISVGCPASFRQNEEEDGYTPWNGTCYYFNPNPNLPLPPSPKFVPPPESLNNDSIVLSYRTKCRIVGTILGCVVGNVLGLILNEGFVCWYMVTLVCAALGEHVGCEADNNTNAAKIASRKNHRCSTGLVNQAGVKIKANAHQRDVHPVADRKRNDHSRAVRTHVVEKAFRAINESFPSLGRF